MQGSKSFQALTYLHTLGFSSQPSWFWVHEVKPGHLVNSLVKLTILGIPFQGSAQECCKPQVQWGDETPRGASCTSILMYSWLPKVQKGRQGSC